MINIHYFFLLYWYILKKERSENKEIKQLLDIVCVKLDSMTEFSGISLVSVSKDAMFFFSSVEVLRSR